jgi:hypothetical protein
MSGHWHIKFHPTGLCKGIGLWPEPGVPLRSTTSDILSFPVAFSSIWAASAKLSSTNAIQLGGVFAWAKNDASSERLCITPKKQCHMQGRLHRG